MYLFYCIGQSAATAAFCVGQHIDDNCYCNKSCILDAVYSSMKLGVRSC